MFFLTMFAPLHNYSFLGSKILFLMIAWMCNASLLLANYGEKNLFLFLGCNFFFFCFLSKIRLEMLVCTGLYPILSLVCVCFFLQCLQHYIITFFYGWNIDILLFDDSMGCNASLLLIIVKRIVSLFSFLGCIGCLLNLMFLVKNKVGNAGMQLALPDCIPVWICFFLRYWHHYIIMFL